MQTTKVRNLPEWVNDPDTLAALGEAVWKVQQVAVAKQKKQRKTPRRRE